METFTAIATLGIGMRYWRAVKSMWVGVLLGTIVMMGLLAVTNPMPFDNSFVFASFYPVAAVFVYGWYHRERVFRRLRGGINV